MALDAGHRPRRTGPGSESTGAAPIRPQRPPPAMKHGVYAGSVESHFFLTGDGSGVRVGTARRTGVAVRSFDASNRPRPASSPPWPSSSANSSSSAPTRARPPPTSAAGSADVRASPPRKSSAPAATCCPAPAAPSPRSPSCWASSLAPSTTTSRTCASYASVPCPAGSERRRSTSTAGSIPAALSVRRPRTPEAPCGAPAGDGQFRAVRAVCRARRRSRWAGSVARSIAVQAMARPPSRTARSAAGVVPYRVKSGWCMIVSPQS